MARWAVILAGGSGTRLWPASRAARPKQFLPLGPGGISLLAAAVARGRSVAGDRVVVVTARAQQGATIAEVGAGVRVLAEPVGRNTAAAIALAAAVIALEDPAAALAILPADQFVRDEDGLAAALARGLGAAEATDVIGTVGIVPTRPETGFGYLEVGHSELGAIAPVARFVEKPDLPTATTYVTSGRFLWNAGMFFITARRVLAELEAHLPATAAAARAIAARPEAADTLYGALASISIDHAVMEKATGVVTIPVSVGWDDVGSWSALPALRGTLPETQITVDGPGEAIVIDGDGNVIATDAPDTLIATVGVSNVIVVRSGDAVLVIDRDRAQDVRKVVELLQARGLTRYL